MWGEIEEESRRGQGAEEGISAKGFREGSRETRWGGRWPGETLTGRVEAAGSRIGRRGRPSDGRKVQKKQKSTSNWIRTRGTPTRV